MAPLLAACALVSACSADPYRGPQGNPVSSAPAPPVATSRAGTLVNDLVGANDPTQVTSTLLADYTPDSDPNLLLGKPGQYTSVASFTDSRCDRVDPGEFASLVIENGGIVEVWPDAASAQSRIDGITRLRVASQLRPDETDIISGSVVVRLCRGLRDNEVAGYQATLDKVASSS